MYEWVEIRYFRYLLSILEKQGFRAASEELHTVQPNLTRHARQFEENTSVHLYRRLKNGRIIPTETGIAFIPLARLLLETKDEVMDALIAIDRGQIGFVQFGCTPLVDPDVFRTFCSLHTEIVPRCPIRPTHGDIASLAEEVAAGLVDTALITLPLSHPELHIEELCRDRLVVCLPKDHALANRTALRPIDLRDHLTVLYHPQRHPDAHQRLLELLDEAGIKIDGYSRASHPSDMQELVKEGHGFALIREGTLLDEKLTTRPIEGVDWTVDTAVIYHATRYPKTLPLLVKKLKRKLRMDAIATGRKPPTVSDKKPPQKHQHEPDKKGPVQLALLG